MPTRTIFDNVTVEFEIDHEPETPFYEESTDVFDVKVLSIAGVERTDSARFSDMDELAERHLNRHIKGIINELKLEFEERDARN